MQYICIYRAQYELLIVGNITFCTLSETSSQRSGLSLCRVYTPQQHPHIKRKMRRRNHHIPPKKHTWFYLGRVCVCVCVPLGPVIKSFTSHFLFWLEKNTGKYESVFSTYIFWDQNSPTPCQVAQAPQARKWGVREVTTFSDTVWWFRIPARKPTWHVWKPVNNGIFTISAGEGVLSST